MEKPSISVVIPVKNGAKTLKRCLDSIVQQTIRPLEIIILDSLSTDDSLAIAKEYGAKLITIPAGTFNHGLTRNVGVAAAKGDLVYLTVQDAWIAERTMFEKMAGHFMKQEIQAVAGHQAIPHEKDKNPFFWYRPDSRPVASKKELKKGMVFAELSAHQRRNLVAWDNVVAMYRKSALVALPFIATDYAEDCAWCRMALEKGWTLVYDPAIIVYHYHHLKYGYTYKVEFAIDYHFYRFFAIVPDLKPFLYPVLQVSWHLGKNQQLSFREKIYWITHNYFRIVASCSSRINFLFVLRLKGEQGIEKRYAKVCSTIPQGELKK